MVKVDSKLIAVTIFSILFSLLVIFNKFILNLGINPILYYFYNQSLGSIFITIYIFGIRKRKFPVLNKQITAKFFLLGFLGSLAIVTSTYGLNLSTSINYGFLIKAGVIFGPLLGLFFLNEKLSRLKLILIPIFFTGAYLISTRGETLIPHASDILIVLSAFLFSTTDVLMKKLTGNFHHETVVSLRALVTIVFLFLFAALFIKDFSTDVPLVFILVSGVLVALVQIMLVKTISLSSVSYLSMMTMVTPVMVAIIGAFLLKEPFTIMHLIGGLIILTCGYLVQRHNI